MISFESIKSKGAVVPLAVLRILLGFLFLWAFLDKMFGLGYSTKPAAAMINGGSPTKGFFLYGSDTMGSLASYFAITDVIIMAAFLLLAVALILGIGMKIANVGGTLLLVMMYISLFPLTATPAATNPIVDYHIMYIFLLFAIYLANAADVLGLGLWWKEQSIVKRFPILE